MNQAFVTNGASHKAAVLLHLAVGLEQTVFALNLVCGNHRKSESAAHKEKRAAVSIPSNASMGEKKYSAKRRKCGEPVRDDDESGKAEIAPKTLKNSLFC
jgi:hypothetical protein